MAPPDGINMRQTTWIMIIMEEKTNSVKKKVELLQLTRNKTKTVLGKRNKQAILRHKEALTVIAKEADNLKREVEQAKLINEEGGDEVAKWSKRR